MKVKKKQIHLSIMLITMLMFQLFFSDITGQATGNTNDIQSMEGSADTQQETKDTDNREEEQMKQGRSETRQGTEYIYDKLNRLIKVTYKDGTVITYIYDKNGNLLETKVSPGSVGPTATVTPTNAIAPTNTVTPINTATPTVTVTPGNTVTPTELPVLTVIPTVITPTITSSPYKENTIEVYYSNDNWDTAYIHYKVGNGEWTQVPGKQMSSCDEQKGYTWKYVIELGEATEATVCFNNGSGKWDSRNAQNYKVYEGIYGIKEETVSKLEIPIATPTVTEIPCKGNTVEVFYYNKNWSTAYIHYKSKDSSWTKVPGQKMNSSTEQEGYTWKYTIDLGEATETEVCFNNGSGSWDSQNGSNYKVYQGVYGVKSGAVTQIQAPTPTPTPSVTETPYTGNIVEVFYKNDNWNTAYIHYKAGNGSWTKVPGEKMTKTTEQEGYTWKFIIKPGDEEEATVCFNNGSGSWDSRYGANYKVYKGVYGIKDGNVNRLKNILEIYYNNPDWSIAYIHYKIGNGSWTDVPGIKMSSSDRTGYQWKYSIDLGNKENTEVCFNNGNGNWDSKNATNYVMYAGIYGIKGEGIYKIE